MVLHLTHVYYKGKITEILQRIAYLEDVREAGAAAWLRPRGNKIARQRIVIPLRDFMAERRYVLDSLAENSMVAVTCPDKGVHVLRPARTR